MLSSRDLIAVFLMSLCLGSARTKKREYLNVVFVQIILVWTSRMCDFRLYYHSISVRYMFKRPDVQPISPLN